MQSTERTAIKFVNVSTTRFAYEALVGKSHIVYVRHSRQMVHKQISDTGNDDDDETFDNASKATTAETM